MDDTYDEVSLLKDMHNMVLRDTESLKEEEEPKIDMKRLAYFFKKMPLQFPTILDAYLDAMVLDYLEPFLKFLP